jgi:hypothetical protein
MSLEFVFLALPLSIFALKPAVLSFDCVPADRNKSDKNVKISFRNKSESYNSYNEREIRTD